MAKKDDEKTADRPVPQGVAEMDQIRRNKAEGNPGFAAPVTDDE